MNLNDIPQHFNINSRLADYGDGLINNTYVTDDGKYIIQRINTKVFTNPVGMTDNIIKVTNHLEKKGIPTLKFIKSGDKYYYTDEDGNFWRCSKFIDNTVTYSAPPDDKCLYYEGRIIGEFHKAMIDFDASVLCEPIPDFHHTKRRFERFQAALAEDKAGRAKTVTKEIGFFIDRENYASIILDGFADGSIPLRVTHNDTKLNNILFDKDTKKPVCLIDLDTVMPGSVLYDYSDAIRICASTSAEDEKDISKVNFSLDCFKTFTEGFLASSELNSREKELLRFSARLMLFETGIRFLTDYLEGDVYFKTTYPEHNLVRARNHIKLIEDIESHEDEIQNIIDSLL